MKNDALILINDVTNEEKDLILSKLKEKFPSMSIDNPTDIQEAKNILGNGYDKEKSITIVTINLTEGDEQIEK